MMAEFFAGRRIGEVHLNPYKRQQFVGCILNKAVEGVAVSFMNQDQPGAIADLVIGVVEGEFHIWCFPVDGVIIADAGNSCDGDDYQQEEEKNFRKIPGGI